MISWVLMQQQAALIPFQGIAFLRCMSILTILWGTVYLAVDLLDLSLLTDVEIEIDLIVFEASKDIISLPENI